MLKLKHLLELNFTVYNNIGVIPAQAAIHYYFKRLWIPAFAGMATGGRIFIGEMGVKELPINQKLSGAGLKGLNPEEVTSRIARALSFKPTGVRRKRPSIPENPSE